MHLHLFTNSATGTFVEFATEAFLYKVMKAIAEGFKIHVVDNFVDEGILQQEFGLFKRDASLTHVEERSVVELSNGRTMSTLHIVGIDLKHRLGIHTSLLGSRQVLVGHLRGSLLSPMFYQDFSCKGTCGLVVEDIFIEFV